MKLHFRGIQVPALGSPRDIAYRNYLIHETRVEAKKQQMLLLITMGCASTDSASSRSEWDKQAKTVFDEYVMLMFGEEVTSKQREEAEMLKYYEEVIKTSKPVIRINRKTKELSVTDLPKF